MKKTTPTNEARTRGQRLRALIATPAGVDATAARLGLGLMILPHGLQKVFGVFGGYGFDGTMGYFTGVLGIPWIVAFLVLAAELLGGLGLIIGLLGRVAALGVGAVMVGGTLMSHVQHGFFMNWTGQLEAGQEGWEFHLLAVALAIVVILRGSGTWSVDRLLAPDAATT